MNTYDLVWLASAFGVSNAVAYLLGYSRGERNAMAMTHESLAETLALAERYCQAIRDRKPVVSSSDAYDPRIFDKGLGS